MVWLPPHGARHVNTRLLILVLSIAGAVASCGGASAAAPLARVVDGQYGGQGIGLDVSATGVSLSFDCSAGRIDGPLVLSRDGTFNVTGTFTPQGNAFGASHTPHAEEYHGSATRDVVRLVMTDPATGDSSVTLIAVLGAPLFVAAC